MLCDDACFYMSYEEHQRRHLIENLARAEGFDSVLSWACYHKSKLEEEWEQKLFEGEVLLWGYDAACKLKKQREQSKKELEINKKRVRNK